MGFALGLLVAGLHWWQYANMCRNLRQNLDGRHALRLFARRWGLTIGLGIICLRMGRVTYGDFMTGFLVASIVVRTASLWLARKPGELEP